MEFNAFRLFDGHWWLRWSSGFKLEVSCDIKQQVGDSPFKALIAFLSFP